MRLAPPRLAPVLLFAAASCHTESLSDFATSAVTASITALTKGDGSTNVTATLREGPTSLTFLQLTSDDALAVTSGTTQRMTELSLLGVVSYSASMPLDAEGTTFTVALTRKKDSGAPHSVMTLPAGFTLASLASASYSRADAGPTVGWSPASSQPMELSFSGNCIDDFSDSAPASSASYSLPAGALHKRTAQATPDGGQAVPDTCAVTVDVDRVLSGTLDPGYAGGDASGIQRRSASFQSGP